MKIFAWAALMALPFAQFSLQAELFIGPTTVSNRFVLATGQAAIISAIYPRSLYDTNYQKTNEVSVDARILSGGTTTRVYVAACKQFTTALVGPVELAVSNSVVISYKVVTNTSIVCPLIKPGTTNTIVIPSGKSAHFFAFGLDGFNPIIPDAEIIKGGVSAQGVDIYGEAEFDGPVTIRFFNPDFDAIFGLPPGAPPQKAYTLPYYLTDQAVVLPDQAVLQSPTGNFEIQMQKSYDLKDWFPSMMIPAVNDQKAYYRLRIAR
jgi:hypothetical protein